MTMVYPQLPVTSDSEDYDSEDSENVKEAKNTEIQNGVRKEYTSAYVTVETQDGTLEQVKVTVDENNFSPNDPILKYLMENGDLVDSNSTNDARAGSGLFRRKGSGTTSSAVDLEGQLNNARGRQGSIITPNLINDIKKNRKRIVAKGGQCNIQMKHVPKKKRQFLKDVFTTAVDMEWRYTLLAFASSFFISWLVFAVIYHAICYIRGDLEPDNLPGGVNQVNNSYKPCIFAIEDFTSSYLFSVETQHTIG